VTELVSRKRFEKDYPDASPNDFQAIAQGWVQGEFVRIAEYWEKNEVGKQTVFAVVLPQGNVENRSEDEIREMAEQKPVSTRRITAARGKVDARAACSRRSGWRSRPSASTALRGPLALVTGVGTPWVRGSRGRANTFRSSGLSARKSRPATRYSGTG
jgi:hypothetical protein